MIHLSRFAYLEDCTLGWIHYKGLKLATIERPWISTPDHRGGKNRESCVPDGEYALRHHHTEKFPNTYALTNPDLDVYYQPGSGRPGRYAILIHVGNYVKDVIGCIAVGERHVSQVGGMRMVTSSSAAMASLRRALVRETGLPGIRIGPTMGTAEIG